MVAAFTGYAATKQIVPEGRKNRKIRTGSRGYEHFRLVFNK